MKKVRAAIGILAIALVTLTTTSCRDNKKEHDNQDGHNSEQMDDDSHMNGTMDEDHSKKQDSVPNQK